MQVTKAILVVLSLVMLSALPPTVLGHGNERGTATANLQNGTVAIEYGRPTLNGREVRSLLAPGSYWRVGADRQTMLTTDVALKLGEGSNVAPGEYAVLVKFDGDDRWSLVLADSVGRGSQPQGIVAEASMSSADLASSVEALTIKLSAQENQGTLTIEWGEIQLACNFTTA